MPVVGPALQLSALWRSLTVSTWAGCLGIDLFLKSGPGRPFRAAERLVVVEVRDTGPGVPKAPTDDLLNCEKIFAKVTDATDPAPAKLWVFVSACRAAGRCHR